MALSDDLDDLRDQLDSRPPMVKYGDKPGLTIPNPDMNNNLDTVVVGGDVSIEAARIAITAGEDAFISKGAAEAAATSVVGKEVIASDAAIAAASSEIKAEEWAIKLGGPVQGSDYSAKYYAQQAGSIIVDQMNVQHENTATISFTGIGASGSKLKADYTGGKDGVGLGNVNNTSDADKPVSTAQQDALDLKLDITDLPTGATVAQLRSGTLTAQKTYAPKVFYDAAAFVTLTSATTITPNLNSANNFTLALAHNATLSNPTGAKSGQSGTIYITHNGSRTLSFGANWEFIGGVPELGDGEKADVITYQVVSSTKILASFGSVE